MQMSDGPNKLEVLKTALKSQRGEALEREEALQVRERERDRERKRDGGTEREIVISDGFSICVYLCLCKRECVWARECVSVCVGVCAYCASMSMHAYVEYVDARICCCLACLNTSKLMDRWQQANKQCNAAGISLSHDTHGYI